MYNPIDNLFFDDIARFRFISKTSALYRLKLIIGPNEISFNNGEIDNNSLIYDDNEYLIPEDMYGQIKDIIYKRDLLNQHRETDETPNVIKF